MTDQNVALNILAEDKKFVCYRKKFVELTDSIAAAILLNQFIYFWTVKNRKPFYKFRDACNHGLYKEGDSWCEELGWTLYEFDTALKTIATKVTKGVSKKDLLKVTDIPERQANESDIDYCNRFADALRHIVIYWTDSNRVTWYQINEPLLGKFITYIYLDKYNGLRNLKKTIHASTLKKRGTKKPEKNKGNINLSSRKTTDKPERQQNIFARYFAQITTAIQIRWVLSQLEVSAFTDFVENELSVETLPNKKNEMQEVVCFTFNIKPGAWAGKLGNFVTGRITDKTAGTKWDTFKVDDPPMTPQETVAFGLWYRATDRFKDQKAPPTTPETLRDRIEEFRAATNYNTAMKRAEAKLRELLPVPEPPKDDEPLVPKEEVEAMMQDIFKDLLS